MNAHTTLQEEKAILAQAVTDLTTELNTTKNSVLAARHKAETQAKTHRERLEAALEEARKTAIAKADAERRMNETNDRFELFVKDHEEGAIQAATRLHELHKLRLRKH